MSKGEQETLFGDELPEKEELIEETSDGVDLDVEEESLDEGTSRHTHLEDEHGPLRQLVDFNFMQYASYVICDRASPNVADGL